MAITIIPAQWHPMSHVVRQVESPLVATRFVLAAHALRVPRRQAAFLSDWPGGSVNVALKKETPSVDPPEK